MVVVKRHDGENQQVLYQRRKGRVEGEGIQGIFPDWVIFEGNSPIPRSILAAGMMICRILGVPTWHAGMGGGICSY